MLDKPLSTKTIQRLRFDLASTVGGEKFKTGWMTL
jgi:hypothetical protein